MQFSTSNHKEIQHSVFKDDDKTATSRKQDHIALAFESQIGVDKLDSRFYYEPLLSGHPNAATQPISFLGKQLQYPIWISSMTGGTEWAKTINHNLARVAKDFGFGMGLGSCRLLLTDHTYFKDFDVRPIMGYDLPLYANLGIAQLEQLIATNQTDLISRLIDKLQADGLIIHVNPLQEWLQPEGDHFSVAPIETIQKLLNIFPNVNFIVKEVGQGMGYKSLETLLQLPLQAIDFAANGGTNFAKLELLRSDRQKQNIYAALANVGHSAEEMVKMTNEIVVKLGDKCVCRQVIISGGVQNFLDGYYLTQKLNVASIYGQASSFLKHARSDYDTLYQYAATQVEGFKLAQTFLTVK